jgi:hypothetical protein
VSERTRATAPAGYAAVSFDFDYGGAEPRACRLFVKQLEPKEAAQLAMLIADLDAERQANAHAWPAPDCPAERALVAAIESWTQFADGRDKWLVGAEGLPARLDALRDVNRDAIITA